MNTDYTKAQECLIRLNDPIHVKRGIHIEEAIPENSLLFVGINPSFDDKKDPIVGDDGYSPTYKLEGAEKHPYFSKAVRIAGINHLPFGHHDLFPLRERNQKVIEGLFVDEGSRLKPIDEHLCFIEETLRWSEQTILASRPQMIVVINAFASRLFFDYCFQDDHFLLGFKSGDKELWNPELGADFLRIDGHVVPILFSGMLSGQRALDRWSEFRLEWHIQHVLSNKKLWPR